MRRDNSSNSNSSYTFIVLFVILSIGLLLLRKSIHQIDEGISSTPNALFFFFNKHCTSIGHVGVYWRGGALMNYISEPGFHFLIPFYETYEQVQVTVQTDKVQDIPCARARLLYAISYDANIKSRRWY